MISVKSGLIISMLSTEVDFLFFFLQKELQELQKRLVVLGCQLRKAEVSKRTYEVATEKLIRFAEVRESVQFRNIFCNYRNKPNEVSRSSRYFFL